MVKTIILDLFKFIRKPEDSQIKLNLKNKFCFILILLILELTITYLIILPVIDAIDEILKIEEERINYSFETFRAQIFLYILLVPLVEELIFRYILRYKKIYKRFLSKEKWYKIFPILVYFLAISFGLFHLTNYTNNSSLFYILAPVIVLSQLFGSFIITFIRVRLNFFSGVVYHWIWNFIAVIIIPLIYFSLDKPIKESNNTYSIAIEEKLFFEKNKPQYIKIDSSNGKILKIDAQQYSIQHILDTIYAKGKYNVEDEIINIKFNSKKNGISKEDLLQALQKDYNIK